jgi:hypothetical protein
MQRDVSMAWLVDHARADDAKLARRVLNAGLLYWLTQKAA